LGFQVQDQVADDVKVIYSNSGKSRNLYIPPVVNAPREGGGVTRPNFAKTFNTEKTKMTWLHTLTKVLGVSKKQPPKTFWNIFTSVSLFA